MKHQRARVCESGREGIATDFLIISNKKNKNFIVQSAYYPHEVIINHVDIVTGTIREMRAM